MRRGLAVGLLLAMTHLAAAEPSKLLVLQSEGRVEAKTRAKIDAAIVKLAKTGPDQVSLGEITYSDAAALVGCKPEEASCQTEVIGTLAVDEIVITTITAKPGGFEVAVRRVGKGAPREASALVTADKTDKLDLIAPLFVAKTTTTTPVTTPPVVIGPQPAVTTTTTPPVTEPTATDTPPDTAPTAPVATVDPIVKPTIEPAGSDRPPLWKRRRAQIAGMATGGGMVFISLLLWNSANDIQAQVDDFPVRNVSDLEALRRLEDKGDSRASWRNVFLLGGLALGGVSTYFYIKGRRAKPASTTAWLAPTIFDHGAGITFSIGGSR